MANVEPITSVSIEQETGVFVGPASPKSSSSTNAPVVLDLVVCMNTVVMLIVGVLILSSL